jgi:hypothetical protein
MVNLPPSAKKGAQNKDIYKNANYSNSLFMLLGGGRLEPLVFSLLY